MGKIRLLPDALASQVAAGEVVERPASVIKELVENAIDAEAGSVEVRVERGGIALMRVLDDGCGMTRDDALMCVERHATSKIRSKEDLGAIGTLGFRGEALPSIASVSRFRLTTRESGALTGTEVSINGGKMMAVKDSGEAPGTQVEVRSLFYNVPARRKFLRTENTEFSHVEQQVRTQAIAHPDLRFALVRDGRVIFQLAATEDLRERVAGLVGQELAGRLLPLESEGRAGVTLRGFIGPPGMGRSGRQQQMVYLNGRPVDSPVLNYALREGYHTALMKGQHPVCFLFLEMDPSAVDVNVHPAKKEVRFRDGNGVRDAIVAAVQDTLRREMRRPVGGVGVPQREHHVSPVEPEVASSVSQGGLNLESGGSTGPSTFGKSADQERSEWRLAESAPADRVVRAPQEKPSEGGSGAAAQMEATGRGEDGPGPVASGDGPSPMRAEQFRLLGVLGRLYVLLEGPEGLVLMDQHAAHERVLFEEMRRRMEDEGVPTQKLLMPLVLELPPRDLDLLSGNLDALARLGIVAEPFGGNSLKVDGVPTFFRSDEPQAFLDAVVEELRGHSERTSSMRLGEDMVATTVCRHAVKANDPLRDEELRRLLEDLLRCELPYCCPHGRPTLIQISYAELERKFGRRS